MSEEVTSDEELLKQLEDDSLRGAALNAALAERGLSTTGRVSERQARLKEALLAPPPEESTDESEESTDESEESTDESEESTDESEESTDESEESTDESEESTEAPEAETPEAEVVDTVEISLEEGETPDNWKAAVEAGRPDEMTEASIKQWMKEGRLVAQLVDGRREVFHQGRTQAQARMLARAPVAFFWNDVPQ